MTKVTPLKFLLKILWMIVPTALPSNMEKGSINPKSHERSLLKDLMSYIMEDCF